MRGILIVAAVTCVMLHAGVVSAADEPKGASAEPRAAAPSKARSAAKRSATVTAKRAAPRDAAEEEPAPSEQTMSSFKTFCKTWLGKLRDRERFNLEHIRWEHSGEGVTGEYVGYDMEHVDDSKVHTMNRTPVGHLTYRELKLRLLGSSEVDALAKTPQIVEQTEVEELFQFQHGGWAY